LKEKVRKYSFHERNRILAGLSEGVLVVSAGEKSGTSITAGKALDYGRDVFALPYNAGVKQGEGCNALLKKGASLVTDSEDILSFYGFGKRAKPQVKLTSEEEMVLKVLQEAGELHTAVIAERTGLKIFEATAALSSLEMKNLAVKAGGNRYSAL
ncbi:MAG: DNA-processing protein DprA, partial [Clostridia bacterium]|nr:DNA-processing protein DprA [Clostridia bacterium]